MLFVDSAEKSRWWLNIPNKSPGGTNESSPAIHRRVGLRLVRVPEGRLNAGTGPPNQKIKWCCLGFEADTEDGPDTGVQSSLRDETKLKLKTPAINRRATFERPSGTAINYSRRHSALHDEFRVAR